MGLALGRSGVLEYSRVQPPEHNEDLWEDVAYVIHSHSTVQDSAMAKPQVSGKGRQCSVEKEGSLMNPQNHSCVVWIQSVPRKFPDNMLMKECVEVKRSDYENCNLISRLTHPMD